MQFLIDKSPADVKRKAESALVGGQLLTPLTRYRNWGGRFAIDNGAFSGFRANDFSKLLAREEGRKDECLFVTVPDVVASARRTLEVWEFRTRWADGWPMALVMQDGMEDMEIPWDEMQAVFIGGLDPWKDSRAAADIVKTARLLGIHVHVGRVNTPRRFRHFAELGANTCDGSGVARYDHMLAKIETHMSGDGDPTLFDMADRREECTQLAGSG